jgi:hypothetical protein
MPLKVAKARSSWFYTGLEPREVHEEAPEGHEGEATGEAITGGGNGEADPAAGGEAGLPLTEVCGNEHIRKIDSMIP